MRYINVVEVKLQSQLYETTTPISSFAQSPRLF